MSGWRMVVLVARVWGARQLGAALLGTAALALLWQSRLAVPMRRDVAEAIWPLAPALLAFTVPAVAARAWATEERVAPRSGFRRRLAFVAAVAVASTALCAALGAVHPFGVLLRNSTFLVGLGLAGAAVLPAPARWVAPVMLPITMWLLGGRVRGLEPAGWAVLLHDSGSGAATAAALVAGLLGATLFVARARPMFE